MCWKESKFLFNDIGKNSKALSECLTVLTPEQKERVKQFPVDIHDALMSVVRRKCPNALICLDSFHVAKNLNENFDQVKKAEFKKAREEVKRLKKKSDFMTNMPSRLSTLEVFSKR